MRPTIGITCDGIREGGPARKHFVNDPYAARVLEAGGLPVLLPAPEPSLATESAAAYLPLLDGVLFSGGDDVDPALYGQARHVQLGPVDEVRDAFEIALLRVARRAGIPILAICRGVQVANVALGGTLHQDLAACVGERVRHRRGTDGEAPSHSVSIEAGSRLRHLAGSDSALVNSFHHQAADRVAPGLVVSARSADGVPEGLEDPSHPFFVGVQWHPERAPGDSLTSRLFAAFVAAASARREAREGRSGATVPAPSS
jgi:putative glutamine amidotransferase